MAEFVFDDGLRLKTPFGHKPPRPGGDQSGIFHTSRVQSAVRGIDHGDAVVWVGSNPLVIPRERAFQSLDVAGRGRTVSGRHQHKNLHWSSASGPRILKDGVRS